MPIQNDSEMTNYDGFGLMNTFLKYLTIPAQGTYNNFQLYVIGYYKQSPVDCLDILERYQNDWIFKVLFWQTLVGIYKFIRPTTITLTYHHELLTYISRKNRRTFLNCCCSNKAKFKTGLGEISRLTRLAEKISFELKSKGISGELISSFDDLIAIWKYLIRNISIDLENKTIDYYSLSRTINEICVIVKTDSSSIVPSLRLSKCYALLWFYLRHIYMNNCTEIFDTRHHHRTLISYLILKFWGRFDFYIDNDFYPNCLRLLFKKFYSAGFPNLKYIAKYLRKYDRSDLLYLTTQKKISSFFVLSRCLTESFKGDCPNGIWRVRALAELEVYHAQRVQKVDRSTNSSQFSKN